MKQEVSPKSVYIYKRSSIPQYVVKTKHDQQLFEESYCVVLLTEDGKVVVAKDEYSTLTSIDSILNVIFYGLYTATVQKELEESIHKINEIIDDLNSLLNNTLR